MFFFWFWLAVIWFFVSIYTVMKKMDGSWSISWKLATLPFFLPVYIALIIFIVVGIPSILLLLTVSQL